MATKSSRTNEAAELQIAVGNGTGAYVAKDLVGGKLQLPLPDWDDGAGFLIQSVMLADQHNQRVPMDVVFFGEDPAATTFTDADPLDIADADLLKVMGYASIIGYAEFNDNAFGAYVGPAIVGVLAPGVKSLYAAVVARGGVTYAAATDLQLRLGILRV